MKLLRRLLAQIGLPGKENERLGDGIFFLEAKM